MNTSSKNAILKKYINKFKKQADRQNIKDYESFIREKFLETKIDFSKKYQQMIDERNEIEKVLYSDHCTNPTKLADDVFKKNLKINDIGDEIDALSYGIQIINNSKIYNKSIIEELKE